MNSEGQHSEKAVAFLFANGTAVFLNRRGRQITKFQMLGWKGLHFFIKKYPDAPISVQRADPIRPNLIRYFLRNIKEPEV